MSKTYEEIKQRVLNNTDINVDKREGSFLNNMASPLSYELAKLTREINNSINDTDSLKGKQLLLSLEDEITQRQADRTKMSEYESNFLQKKYVYLNNIFS